jgi:hypothetical protein
MSKAFWIFAALDGCALLTLLVMTLSHKGHKDGGREMSRFFFLLLTLVVLGGACAEFAWSSNPVVRWAMLALVLLTQGFYAFVGLGSGIQKLTTDAGSGYANPDMAATSVLSLMERGAGPKAADFREELNRKLRHGQEGFEPSAELQELARRAMAN